MFSQVLRVLRVAPASKLSVNMLHGTQLAFQKRMVIRNMLRAGHAIWIICWAVMQSWKFICSFPRNPKKLSAPLRSGRSRKSLALDFRRNMRKCQYWAQFCSFLSRRNLPFLSLSVLTAVYNALFERKEIYSSKVHTKWHTIDLHKGFQNKVLKQRTLLVVPLWLIHASVSIKSCKRFFNETGNKAFHCNLLERYFRAYMYWRH